MLFVVYCLRLYGVVCVWCLFVCVYVFACFMCDGLCDVFMINGVLLSGFVLCCCVFACVPSYGLCCDVLPLWV